MKRLLFLPILLFNLHFLYSQPIQVQLALQSGLSVPLLDFSATNLQKGSFALPGFTGSAELKVLLNDNWGGYVQAGLNLNPIAVGILGYEKVQSDPFLKDVYIRSEAFKVIHFMAGPSYQARVWKSFLIEGQLSAGMFYSTTPYQLYKPDYHMASVPYFEITSAYDYSFAYGAGIRLIYDITPCYQIAITNQLMHSQAKFDFFTGVNTRTDVRNITLWNTSLTLALKLFEIHTGKEKRILIDELKVQ